MKKPPCILVKIVHISGPLKGAIQEFYEDMISVGRHPSCTLRFPPDLDRVSRQHAEITREGNRFKLIDHSANRTFVNGKPVKEAYLKSGDVLTFAEDGPKVSFLTQIKDARAENENPAAIDQVETIDLPVEDYRAHHEHSLKQKADHSEGQEEILVQKVKMPLSIQYGPTLRHFKEVPVMIGKNQTCDFILDLPSINDHQAQIFFSQNEYRVKDLTGQGSVRINGQSITVQAPLHVNDILGLSPHGPAFRFDGEGRLAEIE